MNIKEHFANYAKFSTKEQNSLKYFCFLDKKVALMRYLKENKAFIIKHINYSFFESDEPYLLSVFSDKRVNFIHINSRLSKNYLLGYESQNEYENFLAIYGSFAILIHQNFQIQDLNDSRLNIYVKDFLMDLTFKVYYDDAFRLNLQEYIKDENEVLKYVYRYGYNYLLGLFRAYFNKSLEFDYIAKILKIDSNELAKLYRLYKSRILIGE